MDKLREEIRDLLKANITFWHGIPTDIWIEEISQATNQILKLFNEEIDKQYIAGYNACISDFSLEKSAELRKKKTGRIYG
jgi:hypothetical protein